MTPGMETALSARQVMLVGLLRIEFPGWTLRLADGSIAIDWEGEVYTGADDRFGTIGAMEAIDEGAGDTMPGLDLVLMPPSLSAAVDLVHPGMQSSPVRVWLAAVDRGTGIVVPDPELLFAGEVDVATLQADRGTRSVAIEVASVFERLMEPDEGMRLADSVHQSIWPGELGLANMTGTAINKLWGPGEKAPSFTMVPQGGGGGGDYGFGYDSLT